MASIEEIREARLSKLKLLEEKGINAFPVHSTQDKTLKEVVAEFDTLKDSGALNVVGRILSIRSQGKIVFLTLNDGTGNFQVLLKSGEPLPEETFELFNAAYDIGDFIGVKGTLFLTKREEKTILAEDVTMLAKSLRPLPEKWSGLTDIEERFRKRYLDVVSNPEVKERFIIRSRIITRIREILDRKGYLEVETPALQPLYGGASAEPFVTHHNALDTDLYLRISDELYLKRLLVGGFPKIYEIARDFRNEGIDTTHNPEFTMLEFYEAFSDAPKQRAFVEEMMRELALLVNPTGMITNNGKEIDFNAPFSVRTYSEIFKEHTHLGDAMNASQEELVAEATRLGAHFDPKESRVKILDAIFKKFRSDLLNPLFVVDYPVDYLPLTKRKEGEETIVDAFQFYAGGLELVKAFSELNDPIDQRARFVAQEKVLAEGEKDAQPLDEEFLEAMEYGMPPAGGVGIGIDRLSMFFTDTQNIKEVILFPTLRPKGTE